MTPAKGKRKIDRTERPIEAFKLRIRGRSLKEISDHLGYSGGRAAHRGMMTVLDRIPREAAEEMRKLELARLDVMIDAVWDKATEGDGPAIDRILKLIGLRAKFLGLDTPSKVEVTGTGPIKVDLTWSDDVVEATQG